MLYGYPIASQLEAWWREHAGRHDDPEWASYLQDFQATLGQKCIELTTEHENIGPGGRRVFGMSKAGGCTRSAGLKLLGYDSEPFTGSTLATFHLGHVIECIAVATMRTAGFTIEGQQEPVVIPPFMASFSDGIITSDPTGALPTPCILSVKSQGYKKSGKQRGSWVRQGFPALPFDGVRKGQPSWFAQVQAEMHGAGIANALVLVVAKDIVKAMENDPYLGAEGNGSLTFYTELIEYDPHFVETQLLPVWTSAWQAVEAGQPPAPMYLRADSTYARLPSIADTSNGWGGPNQQATGTFNPCFSCDFAKGCASAAASSYRKAS